MSDVKNPHEQLMEQMTSMGPFWKSPAGNCLAGIVFLLLGTFSIAAGIWETSDHAIVGGFFSLIFCLFLLCKCLYHLYKERSRMAAETDAEAERLFTLLQQQCHEAGVSGAR